VPLIFMGEEYGETNPFLYFVSHGDPELVEAVRSGRRKEFESFGWGDDVPDPQSEETFRRSMLDRARAAQPEHAAVFQLYHDLIALREEEPMLLPDGADLEVIEANGCITMLRRGRGARDGALLTVFNCTTETHEVALPDRSSGRWTLRLTTDAIGYGGEGRTPEEIGGEPIAVGAASSEAWRAASGSSLGGAPPATGEPRRLLGAETTPKRTVTMPPSCAALYIRQQ
jgi:maltooligosyltrehalose trehalohydrolase